MLLNDSRLAPIEKCKDLSVQNECHIRCTHYLWLFHSYHEHRHWRWNRCRWSFDLSCSFTDPTLNMPWYRRYQEMNNKEIMLTILLCIENNERANCKRTNNSCRLRKCTELIMFDESLNPATQMFVVFLSFFYRWLLQFGYLFIRWSYKKLTTQC